jgi:hypothetical protein
VALSPLAASLIRDSIKDKMKKRKEMLLARLRYEIRLLGRPALLTPCVIMIGGGLLAIVLQLSHTK